jgi:hypothetical protein
MAWQNRLPPQREKSRLAWPSIWIDATYVKVRRSFFEDIDDV